MLGYIYIGWRGSAGGREKADRQHKSLEIMYKMYNSKNIHYSGI